MTRGVRIGDIMYYKTESIPLDQLSVGDTIVRVTESGRDTFEGTVTLSKVCKFEVDHKPIVVLEVTGGGINCPRPEHTEATVLRVLTHAEHRSELEKMTHGVRMESTMGKTAQLVRFLTGWAGNAALYRLSEPVTLSNASEDEPLTQYVIVSGVRHEWAHEAMIFPADAAGNAIDMLDLACARGTTSHDEALGRLGYTIA